MVRTDVLCVILLIIFGSIEGATMYGKCTKFGPNDEKPVLENADMYCLRNYFEPDIDYCIQFDCPPLDCLTPLKPERGKCQYCKGTCSYGGKVYKVGDSFGCLDGKNNCHCLENNGISSTWAGQIPMFMCRPKKDD